MKTTFFFVALGFIILNSCTTPKIYTEYSKVNPVINFNLCGIGPLIPRFSTEEDVKKFLGKPDVYDKKWVHRCAICLKELSLTMKYKKHGLTIYLTRNRRHDKRTIFYMKIDSTSNLKTESGFGIGSDLSELGTAFGDLKMTGVMNYNRYSEQVRIELRDQLGRYASFKLVDYSRPKTKNDFRVHEIWF